MFGFQRDDEIEFEETKSEQKETIRDQGENTTLKTIDRKLRGRGEISLSYNDTTRLRLKEGRKRDKKKGTKGDIRGTRRKIKCQKSLKLKSA